MSLKDPLDDYNSSDAADDDDFDFSMIPVDEFFADDWEVGDPVADCIPCPSPERTVNNSSVYEDIPGFDYEAGQSYIYPTNYPIRDYQFNIVNKCLFKNTLVSLPTGLGKTFIAAVVMYNFYRWYPCKKVIFLAPTKPLVSQQVEACYNIMGNLILEF